MATHLILLCCAATASARAGGFPAADDALDAGGAAKAARRTLDRTPDIVLRSPARAALETAEAMGLASTVDERLRDMDFGPWNGRSLNAVHTDDPDGLAAWIARPERGAPGGETLAQVRERIRLWLGEIAAPDRTVLAVTHVSTIRAIVAEAIDLPDAAAFRFDIAPLSAVALSFHRVWRLRALGSG